MSEQQALQAIADPYRVQEHDTLSAIARRSGQPLAELMRWNGIKNPNRLQVGQVLYLSEASSFGVTAVFLDALRYPIANLNYKLVYDGKTVQGKTGANGQAPQQVTRSASSVVEIWVQDAQRQWQQLTSTVSGYGHKLISLASPYIVVQARTAPHPAGAPPIFVPAPKSNATPTRQADKPLPPTGTPSKNNPAVTVKQTKGPQGQPVVVIGVVIPEDLRVNFDSFTGGEISEGDWEATAADLKCEANVLKAFAKVESGGNNSFWRLNKGEGAHMPALLFERHYFSRLTGAVYDKDHPDVSWPTGYRKSSRLGRDDKQMHDGRVDADDIYADYASAYLRLLQAYRLDKEAALKSCSWGKFQIMGDNFKLCGADSVKEFVQKMCTSEHAQIELVAGFIRRKPQSWKNPKKKELGKEISLWDAVKTKNWRAIAFNYNGPGYETYAYHTKLEQAYEAFKKQGTA